MIKVAIIGCGKIAESHADVIKSIKNARLAATCDREILMARQLAERYGEGAYYDDLSLMLDNARPEVVHITTPPQSHFEIARTCLNAGCHVFVEKPFTVNGDEATELINLAVSKNLKITVGTDEQFSHIAVEMRRLVAEGWLGDPPYHMDCYYCYDLGDERYARAFLKNRSHWLWQLPGQLIQNIIPHAVMKICEFLSYEGVDVQALGFTSDFLRRLDESHLKDELRAIIKDGKQSTAYLTFSTQIRPPIRQFSIFGTKNGLILDQDHHALLKIPGVQHKSYVEKTVPLNNLARQYRKNMFTNIRLFLKRQFQMKRGLYNLIDLFYKSIENDAEPPIPYEQILMCSRVIDSVVRQLYSGQQKTRS
ncbi:MAG: Gfo/Idh/MocA family oxidoreductase [Candidatus Saccharicenans sp.]|nr:Gfo/Idh/MocA family oxidoreductase [Candidatus Saccharicenans sp.]MDI6848902.1 Gfo/Idh/MocA family oxidoreductase [Candidatus Saccharicenans sp.]